MTPDRLREVLALLRWSQRGLAAHLGYASDATVGRWCAGRAAVPPPVAAWLEHAADWLRRHPAPTLPDIQQR